MKNLQDSPEAVVIGASNGGLNALQTILSGLAGGFSGALLIVQHRKADVEDLLSQLLRRICPLPVLAVTDKLQIFPGHVYVAPANYHMLVERNKRLSLSVDAHVSYSRPSIDVLFETAAEAYRSSLLAVLLTGANYDGTAGIQKVKACGGITIAQDPISAESSIMPQSAIDSGCVDHIVPLAEIADFVAGYFDKLPDRYNI